MGSTLSWSRPHAQAGGKMANGDRGKMPGVCQLAFVSWRIEEKRDGGEGKTQQWEKKSR